IRDGHVTGVQTCALPISSVYCLAGRFAMSRARIEAVWEGLETMGSILIVDDEPSIRQLVGRWLTDAGFTYSVAENADTAMISMEIGRASCRERGVVEVAE